MVQQAARSAGFQVFRIDDPGLAQFRQALLELRSKADPVTWMDTGIEALFALSRRDCEGIQLEAL